MIFSNLINLGLNSDMEFYQRRESKMVNLFEWISLIGSIIGINTVFFIQAQYPTFISLFSVLTPLFVLFLNYKKLYNAATYTFVATTNISIFVIVQQYDMTVGNYLYYFPVIFCIALIHNPSKSNARTIFYF